MLLPEGGSCGAACQAMHQPAAGTLGCCLHPAFLVYHHTFSVHQEEQNRARKGERSIGNRAGASCPEPCAPLRLPVLSLSPSSLQRAAVVITRSSKQGCGSSSGSAPGAGGEVPPSLTMLSSRSGLANLGIARRTSCRSSCFT